MNSKTYEVELRGRLESKQKKQLLDFLEKNGKKIKEYKRTQWIFDKSHDKTIDFRIKQTNGETEFSLKAGKLSDANRHELSIPFSKNKLNQAIDMAKYMGYKDGLIAKRNAKIYNYQGIEWAVVDVPGHSSYFEAEIVVESKGEGEKAEQVIRKVANDLSLRIFSKDELMEYIKTLDEEANESFEL